MQKLRLEDPFVRIHRQFQQIDTGAGRGEPFVVPSSVADRELGHEFLETPNRERQILSNVKVSMKEEKDSQ